MRLRVVPGFISPPPGFGGLGYTPTARACVNISIPLQLRVIDMLDVFTPLLKFFANEPLERLMYTIIIFGLTLWLIPKEFTVAFNAYTEIPWLFQIIVFAFSFVVAISFSRLRAHIQSIIHYYQSNEYCFVYLRKKSLYLKISLKQEILLSLLLAVTRL